MIEVAIATSEEDRQAAFRLRYEVFVQERGRFGPMADHERRLFSDPQDATGCLLLAREAGRPVGTVRLHHGGAHGIPADLAEQLELRRLAASPFADLALLEWLAIAAAQRGSRVAVDLIRFALQELRRRDTRLMVMRTLRDGPLPAFYRALGFQAYLPHTVPAIDRQATVPMVALLPRKDRDQA